jgi:catalase
MKLSLLAILGTCALALVARAEEGSSSQPQSEQRTSSYRPELGDIMANTQFRHFKLAFAGTLRNWDLARYEAGQMRKSFDTAARLYPTFDGAPLAKLVEDVSKPALKEIDKAIGDQNLTAFANSFKKLTEGCNSCHRSSQVAFIVIRIPTSSPFSNQNFAPPEK